MDSSLASIIVASIGSFATILTVIVTSISNASKTKNQVESLKCTVDRLDKKVEQHNTFDRRIVALETEINFLKGGH